MTQRGAEMAPGRAPAPLLQIPPGALAGAGGMGDWAATVVWSLVPERVTWREDLFLEAYGIRRDPRKIAYYHLLYDMLP